MHIQLASPADSGMTIILENDLLRGFLIPIINTTFIELSTATYVRNSCFPHLILRLNLLSFFKSQRYSLVPKYHQEFQDAAPKNDIPVLIVHYSSPGHECS